MISETLRRPQYLPDGAEDFGSGVIGPNILDHINFSYISGRAWRGADRLSGGLLNKKVLPVLASLVTVLACAPGAPDAAGGLSPEQQAIVKAIQTSEFQLPINGKSWFLGGPHDTNLRGGTKDAIDIGPESVVSCAPGEHKVLDNPPVVASASGTVKAIGNERDRTDPLHSVIKIQAPNGLTLGMEHLDQFKVAVGDTVVAGITEIAKLSCENVPGGHTEGMHAHIYLRGPNGEQIPITGHTFSGYMVQERVGEEYQGSMLRINELLRTADRRRCGPAKKSIADCGGIRNDLITDTQALVANPKSGATPIPTIPEITPTIAKPIPKSASIPELAVEPGLKLFDSPLALYHTAYPINWRVDSSSVPGASQDYFVDRDAPIDLYAGITIETERINPAVTLSAYKEQFVNQMIASNDAAKRSFKEAAGSSVSSQAYHDIDRQKAWSIIAPQLLGGSSLYQVDLVVIVKDSTGWKFTLRYDSKRTPTAKISSYQDAFTKLADYFRFGPAE